MMTNNIYNGYTIVIPSPDGQVFLHCLESRPAELEMVHINIGKSGSSVRAWAEGLSRMINVALKHSKLSEILPELSQISSDRQVLSSRTAIKSAVDAVFYGLLRYQKIVSEAKPYYPPRLTIPERW